MSDESLNHEEIVALRKKLDETVKEVSDLKLPVAEHGVILTEHARRISSSVSGHEFAPVKKIVYTIATVIIVSVIGTLIKMAVLGG